jgi:hypothetical protein
MIPAVPEAHALHARAGTAPAAAAEATLPGRLPRGRKSMAGAALRISLPEPSAAALAADAHGDGRGGGGGVPARRVSALPQPPPPQRAAGAMRALAFEEGVFQGSNDGDAGSECSSSSRSALPGEPPGQAALLASAVELLLASGSDWKVWEGSTFTCLPYGQCLKQAALKP